MAKQDVKAPEAKKGGGKKGILIGIVIILLVANGIQFFFNNEEIKKKENTISVKNDSISNMIAQMDSIETALELKIEELGNANADIEGYKTMLEELKTAKAELEKKNQGLAWAAGKFNEYKKKAEGLEEILRLKDEEIKALKDANAVLVTTVEEKKQLIAMRDDSIGVLEDIRKELEGTVRTAKSLHVANFSFVALDKKGKTKLDQPFKAKKITEIRMDMDIIANPVADGGEKLVYVEVRDPEDAALSSAKGSGTFSDKQNNKHFYTVKQKELYSKDGKHSVISFDNTEAFKTGTYKVFVYIDTELAGGGSFNVK